MLGNKIHIREIKVFNFPFAEEMGQAMNSGTAGMIT